MADFLRDFLILVGIATLLGLFFAGIILIPYEIKYRVEKLRYAYRRKHRFDKNLSPSVIALIVCIMTITMENVLDFLAIKIDPLEIVAFVGKLAQEKKKGKQNNA